MSQTQLTLNREQITSLYVNDKLTYDQIIDQLQLGVTSGALRWFIRKNGFMRDKFEARKHTQMRNLCKLCGNNFNSNSGHSAYCMTCCPTKRDRQRASAYKISYAQYEELCSRQKYTCGMCKIPLQNFKPENVCVDHDHNTCEIRGVLCRACNRTLGIYETFKASSEAYLQIHKGNGTPNTRSNS